MLKLDHLKQIVYKNNDIRLHSIDRLGPILARQKPMQLEELRIVNCPIGATATNALIEILADQSNLTKFGLVKSAFSDVSFPNLCQFVAHSRTLREIDISNNGLRP